MASDRDTAAPAEELLAALDELVPELGSGRDTADADFVALVLGRVGDVLRARRRITPQVRRWCAALDDGALVAVLERVRRDSAGWPRTPGDMAAGLRRRDQAESVLAAVTWVCLGRGQAPAALGPLGPCMDALRRYEQDIAPVIGRSTAEELLAGRAWLLGGQPWTQALRDGTPAAAAEEPTGALQLAGPPSVAIVQRYVSEGEHRALIEAGAARDPGFAAELVATIDAFAATGEERSFVARRWRARAGSSPPRVSPLTYEVERAHFAVAAASDTAGASTVQSIELGPLPDVPAEATLEIGAGRIALFVFPSAPLASVALGDHASTAPGADEVWSVTAPLAAGRLWLRVVAGDGRRCEEQIDLLPG
jgi:hypothetical protein